MSHIGDVRTNIMEWDNMRLYQVPLHIDGDVNYRTTLLQLVQVAPEGGADRDYLRVATKVYEALWAEPDDRPSQILLDQESFDVVRGVVNSAIWKRCTPDVNRFVESVMGSPEIDLSAAVGNFKREPLP